MSLASNSESQILVLNLVFLDEFEEDGADEDSDENGYREIGDRRDYESASELSGRRRRQLASSVSPRS